MKKLLTIAALMFVLSVLLLPGCSVADKSANRVAMIFDSPIADDAFSTACLRGAEKAQKDSGTTLMVAEVVNSPQTAGLQKQFTQDNKYNLIICIGFSHSEPLKQLSGSFKKQNYLLVDGDITDKANVSSLVLRDNESSYLAGALAAMVSKTGKIGFVGGMDIPAIHRFLAGYEAGAHYINPGCQILTGYSGSWLNDGKTKALALQQYGLGADVIFGPSGAGSLGVIEAAKEVNLYAIGVDGDQSPAGPQNVLASTLKHVDIAVYNAIKVAAAGNFKGGEQTSGLKDGGVGLAVNNALVIVTQEMKDRLAEIENQIISGEIIVPGI
jgi:basic membrane protein A and related proteins